ncbi:MAG TPA: YqaJ viral recombinase family protein [Halanaerobiales bacterium]|nr:YqaJ viral recombinase family protein [Halanaerobiales bacterium]
MQAEVLVDTKDLTHEEWLEYRKQGIGGSDAAAAIGLGRWKSARMVWAAKTGFLGEEKDNDAMRLGRDLEGYVAERFIEKRSEETGKEIKLWNVNQILRHSKHKFMLANLDRRVLKESALLECKTTVDRKNEWKIDSFPEYYIPQLQHYLAVTGFEKAYLAVLVLDKRWFNYYEVDRDDELIEYLIQEEKDFWESYVLTGVMPPIEEADLKNKIIDKLYPEAKEGKIVHLDIGINELIEKRIDYKETENKFKNLRQEVETKIKDLLGEAELGFYQGQQVVKWRNINSSRFDSKKFRSEHPDLYSEYLNESSYRRLYI